MSNLYPKSLVLYFLALQKKLILLSITFLLLTYAPISAQAQDIPKPQKEKKKKAKLPPEDLSGAYLANAQYNFTTSGLKSASLNNPTSLQFGPDNRLYVSQQDGVIKAFTIKRNGANDYSVTATETIGLINQIPNYNDDGTLNTSVTKRQVTGILVSGTANQPILYVSSSDSRIGGGSTSGDKNLDTNSGIVSRLIKTSGGWTKVDLVRGLPRSEENHSVNGMQLDEDTNILYLAVGGFTNAGAPSNNFAFICEYALSAAILSIDLTVIDALPIKGSGNSAYKYDIPTLDDPTRSNNPDGSDVNDPFGGNDGLNQAKIVEGGPVQIYSPGFRNAYDLVITKTPGKEGRMYTVDNGANGGWGGHPDNEGSDGKVTNKYVSGEPGSTGPGPNDPKVNNLDNLHYIGKIGTYISGSHYGGHPTPTRANPAGAGLYTHDGSSGIWRTSKSGTHPLPADWPPLPLSMANPDEGDFQNPGETDLALLTFSKSTNGLAEYTASNFNGGLKGSLLAADFGGNIHKITFNEDGNDVTNPKSSTNKLNQDLPFASGFGSQPLDVIAQGDNDVFPGSVWAATYGSDVITIFEPSDFVNCSGTYSTSLDDDNDGYSNADEIDNATNPCSASSMPQDFDKDLLSDLNDPDDDGDGLGDNVDLFALDAQNGLSTHLPIKYDLFNNDPGTGLFGLGFTGLMSNKQQNNDYYNLYEENNLIAGGAVGAFSIVAVSTGDALGSFNNQENGFQFGVNVNSGIGPFTVHASMLAPFFDNEVPQNYQSQGIYIGTGDQDNYVKVTLNANGGEAGFEVVYENAGQPVIQQYALTTGIPTSSMEFYLSVDPIAGTVQAKYAKDGGAVTNLGSPVQVSGDLLTAIQGSPALAVGIIATSREASPFTATWDIINVTADPVSSVGSWQTVIPSTGTPTARHENSFIQTGNKFYLIGGRGIKPVQAYDPINKTWTSQAMTPLELHHFQAVSMDGLIYIAGAFTGSYPYEKPVPDIYIYNPLTDKWIKGPTIPEARRRGAAGVVLHNNKIYLVSGIIDGHNSGHVTWFDEYDPATNIWKTLPDAPRARDHFHAAIVNNKLYLAGGRRSSYATGETFSITVPEVDVFDFETSKWTTLPTGSNIPTQRAGTTTAVLGDELIIIGGESVSQSSAHKETEALNVKTSSWRRLSDLQVGRHGTQAIVSNNSIYIVAGSGSKGGSPELSSQEAFYMFAPSTPIGTALSESKLTAPSEVVFGNSASTKKVTITNSGTKQSIVISSITITGANDFSYIAPYTLPIVIPIGKSIDLNVSFNPTTTGLQTAALSIENSGVEGIITTNLSGGGAMALHRVNSGGSEVTNSIGTFSADQSFSGGSAYTNNGVADISGTADDEMYKSERYGAFSYSLPVASGTYRVRLHFAEIYFGATGGSTGGVGKRVFNVTGEGQALLTNFDIYAEVGAMAALVKEFEVSVTDGALSLDFTNVVEKAKVSAIEVISGTVTNDGKLVAKPTSLHFFSQEAGTTSTPQTVTLSNSGSTSLEISSVSLTGTNSSEFGHNFTNAVTVSAGGSASIEVTFKPASLGTKVAQLNISHSGTSSPVAVGVTGEGIDNTGGSTALHRVNSGGSEVTNSIGTFSADQSFSGGSAYTNNSVADISGTADDEMYKSERYGAFSYSLPVASGTYRVRLHFAEIYFGATGGSTGGVGKRVFNVTGEGQALLTNFDIYAEVGAMAALVKEFEVSVTDGALSLDFTNVVEKAKVSAIEVLSSTGEPVNQAPVADAGPDQTVTADGSGLASVQLSGSGSSDADGTIATYVWAESGVQLATGVSPTVSLGVGIHTVTLTVTDDKGATGSDQVHVTVNSSTSSNQAPVANAGSDQTVTLPSGSTTTGTTLSGSGTDADGTIASYAWNQASGPSAAVFSSTAVASPTVSGLVAGSYVFSLVVTDDKGLASQPDQVSVAVSAETIPGQQVVSFTLVNADTDQDIQAITDGASLNLAALPTKNLNIRANTSPATVGSVVLALSGAEVKSVKENKAPYSLFGDSNGDYKAWTPKVGSYSLKATPYTASGGGGSAGAALTISFSVVDQTSNNQAPVADAGPDQTVTAGTDGLASVQLSGSGSSDADGTIATYVWAESGVQLATGVSPTVSLGVGVHTVTLTVTDDKGATGSDQVHVTVNSSTSSNQAPVANAGSDQTVTLPSGSTTTGTTLSGSGTDADGTIASYAWNQASGPSAAVFSSTAVASPTVSGLVAGSYVFSLVVTDDKGLASQPDQVSVAVSAETIPGQQVVSFTLVNADTDQDIQAITDGASLNLAALPTKNLNIRANTSPATVGSVVLALSGAEVKSVKENKAPYSLFGDSNGDYKAWTPKVGSYSLKATPYTASGGGGSAGAALTISFSVVDQLSSQINSTTQVTAKETSGHSLIVYPNPNEGKQLYLELKGFVRNEEAYITLYDILGRDLNTFLMITDADGNAIKKIVLDRQLSRGVYIIRVNSASGRASVQLVVR